MADQNIKVMDDNFHAALKSSYHDFVEELSQKCKKNLEHQLDVATNPYCILTVLDNAEDSNYLGDGTDSPDYSTIIELSGRYFTQIRDRLVGIVSNGLNIGFLRPWYVHIENHVKPILLSAFSV